MYPITSPIKNRWLYLVHTVNTMYPTTSPPTTVGSAFPPSNTCVMYRPPLSFFALQHSPKAKSFISWPAPRKPVLPPPRTGRGAATPKEAPNAPNQQLAVESHQHNGGKARLFLTLTTTTLIMWSYVVVRARQRKKKRATPRQCVPKGTPL